MAFAQLTHRESLRDIEVYLRAMHPKLYHMGIRGRVSRSTLVDANENRDWRIYADFAQVLISIARPFNISEGKQHDVTLLDNLIIEPGSFYIMDRGNLDYAHLYRFHQNQAYFLIRAKRNLKTRRLYSRPVDKSTGVQCDQTVRLMVPQSAQGYPETLRRIRYCDADKNRRYVFLRFNGDWNP